MSIEEHIERVLSNEKTRSRQKISNEKTDSELVAQAKMRARQCPLEVEDLFSVYGNWSKFYIRVVIMNALVRMMADIHAMRMKYILIRKDEFTGALETLYNIMPNLSPFYFIQNLPKEYQSTVIEELKKSIEYGMSLLRRLQLQTCYVTAFLHTMQSLPAHLRPLAVLILQAMKNMGTVLVRLLFRTTGDVFWINLCAWPLYVATTVFYYKKSRRHTIILSCLVIIFSITFMIHLPMDKFNSCDNVPTISASDKLLGTIVTFIVAIASRSLILVSRLMLIEHIPVEQQLLFYPLAAAFRFLIEYLCEFINELFNLKEVHPAGEMFPTFILMLIATVLGLALDGTSKNPLTSTHVNCYHIKLRRYPKISVYDDDTEMDGIDTSEKA